MDDTWQGDAGDPVMAMNTIDGHMDKDHIYLLVNPSREDAGTWKGLRLWKSEDKSGDFHIMNLDVFNSAVDQADKPIIAVNNFSGLSNSGYVYVAGSSLSDQRVYFTKSINGGCSFDLEPFEVGQGRSPDIAIRSNGTVYVFYLAWTGSGPYTNSIQYRWFNGQWSDPETVTVHSGRQSLYPDKANGSGDPKRSRSATNDDFFVSNGFPRVAVNPANDRIYLVFADLPFPGSSDDRGDVFVLEASGPDGSLTWTHAVALSDDGTDTDQWNPAVAVNPLGTKLFIGFYSRRGDSSSNALIKAYGAKADITAGLAGASFNIFPISATAFPPLFPGTTASTPPCDTWKYDHVWAQAGVCLDENAKVFECPPSPDCSHLTLATYQHFMADDYTWAASDDTYFYYACCDRVETFGSGQQTRRDPNIRLAKILH